MAVIEWGEGPSTPSISLRTSSLRVKEGEGAKIEIPKEKKITPQVKPQKDYPTRKVDLSEVEQKWQDVLTYVRPQNHSIEALLRATRPKSITGKVLTVEVFYKFHKDKLEQEKCRRIVEEAATEVFQSLVKIKFLLGERPRTTEATEKKKEFAERSVESKPKSVVSVAPGNGETTDHDIIEVAKEIFSGAAE